LCGRLDILEIDKNATAYSVSRFNLVGLGVLFGGLSPQNSPVATGLSVDNTFFKKSLLDFIFL